MTAFTARPRAATKYCLATEHTEITENNMEGRRPRRPRTRGLSGEVPDDCAKEFMMMRKQCLCALSFAIPMILLRDPGTEKSFLIFLHNSFDNTIGEC